MFFDLNVPVPTPVQLPQQTGSKKGKGKQPAPATTASVSFTGAQIKAMEEKIDLLVHLGYTVLALNQTVHKKVDPKTHVNLLDSLISQLRPRPGIVFLKRLTIVLDEDSEKGFGLTNANASLFPPYDLIALVPTNQATLSLACLTHTMPSPLTAHIISLPLTLPRLSFHLKHTIVRTALKNGAVFEITYVGALGGENDPLLVSANAAENGPTAKRNWWAAAREITRVTKGKSIIISSGVVFQADLRAPRDVANLIVLLGLAQDAAHSSITKIPKSLVLRAQTRKTYRAVFTEPQIVVPEPVSASDIHMAIGDASVESGGSVIPSIMPDNDKSPESPFPSASTKRRHEDIGREPAGPFQASETAEARKKKRKKNRHQNV